MKKPLLGLAIILFGVGIALYTKAGYKEGNASMRETTPTATATAMPDTAMPATATASAMPAVDMQSMLKNPDAIKKLLDNPMLKNLLSTANEPEPNVVSPPMGK